MSEIPISNNPKPPKRGERVMAKDIAELWQAIKRLSAQQDTERKRAPVNPRIDPLTITLNRIAGDPTETWEVIAEFGHVVPRHNASGASGAPFTIGSLPTVDTPLTVEEGTKMWVKLSIDEYGLLTDADFESGSTWPTDSPPSLIGGDDQSGSSGYRHIRIAEIIYNPTSVTVPAQLKCKQLHTGHIDHFQPELLENLTVSPSTGEARVMKEWNASDGRWDFRYLLYGPGISITENADSIEIGVDLAFNFPHPWKVTSNGNNTVSISAGCVMSWEETSLTLKNFKKYDGTQTVTVTGDGYIYGYIDASLATTADINAGGTDSGGDTLDVPIMRVFPDNTDDITIAFAAAMPSGSSTFYFEIAEVSLIASVATVTHQTLTHNPTLASWLEPP